MLKIIKERLFHWEKIAKPRQELDVKCFCLWLGKSEEQIISEYYSIEKPQLLTRWRRDYGSLIRKWCEALMQGTKVYVTEEKTKMRKVKK